MRRVEYLEDESIYRELVDILRIANSAVNNAKSENRKLLIPEVFSIGGRLYYLLLNGEITSERPMILQKITG